MSRYNLSLKVLYDGRAISQGTRTNANDIRSLQQQAQQQVAQNRALATSNNSVAQSYSGLATAVGGFMALNFAQQQVQNIGQIQLLNARLQGLTSSSQEYAQVQNYLIATSNKHSKVYSAMADSYTKLLALRRSGIVTDTESKQLLEGMSNVASQLGATTTQLSQSLFGMAQGFTAGTLRAEELNQVTEPLPGLLQSLDKAAGLVSGGFRQMVVDGKISSQFFKETLIKAFTDYEGAAERIATTIPAALNRTETAYEQLINRIEQPVSIALVPAIDAATSVLNELTTNQELLEDITTAATALAIVLGGRLATSLTVSAAGFAKSTIAKARLAQETVKLTAAELAAAQANLHSVQTTVNLTGASNILAPAKARLTAATVAHTAAVRGSNVAMRALGGTMSLLGGPAGLIMLAAWGIYEFASSSDDATESVNKLKEASKDLNPYANLTGKQAQGLLLLAQGRLQGAIQLADEARQRFNNPFLKGKFDDVTAAEQRVKDLKNEIVALQSVVGKPAGKAPEKGQDPKELANFQKANANYQQRLALLGKNTELEKVNYEIASGKYASLLPAQQQELQNIAKLIDQKNKQADSEKDFSQLETDLLTEEGRIRRSYTRRIDIARTALDEQGKDSTRYAEIELQLRQQRDAALDKLATDKAARDAQRQNELRQLEDQTRRDRYETEIAELQGFHSRLEAEEAAHEDRKRQVQLRYAGNYGQVVQQFVDLDRASGNDRVAIGLDIGENLAGQAAKHSKKAFKVQQTLNIAKALMSTYTAAAAALELGPIAGPIAAGVITGLGMLQVKSIASQKPPGYQYGGYTNGNKLIEIGERNTPELLELGGKNYIAGGNGGRVFNPSQLPTAKQTPGAGGNTVVNVTVQLIEDASRSGQVEQERTNDSEFVIKAFVADIRQGGDAAGVLSTTFGLQRTGT
ncbi:tape measure protein [Pseudoalteromonas sp. ASV78]|uniref:tape measure protein n=1 Tax=Pseudoalteromonas sp. ASV78 TaxID=3397851 RepID=UPI0039FD8D34